MVTLLLVVLAIVHWIFHYFITNTSLFDNRNKRVKLINFAMSKHLVRDTEQLTDQRGSLAYVSPEILSGKSLSGIYHVLHLLYDIAFQDVRMMERPVTCGLWV